MSPTAELRFVDNGDGTLTLQQKWVQHHILYPQTSAPFEWRGVPVVQAASAVQTQAAELDAVGAGGVQALSQKKATPASVDKAQAAINSGACGVQAVNEAPAGWKLVPVEPTVDQEWAGKNADALHGKQLSVYGTATTAEAALGGVYAELPRAGAIGYASVVDVDSYVTRMTIGPRLPGVRDIALWTTDQLRDFADRTHALRMQAATKAAPGESNYSKKWDAELGRTAMRFVDRAGDVHPGIDDAETICAEFHKAMSEVIERMPHVQRMAAPQQEPGAFRCLHEWDGLIRTSIPPKYACKHCHNFFDASPSPSPSPTPQQEPAPLSDDVVKDAARYRFLAGHCRSTSEHWGGRWSIVVDGPAPKSHDSEDDFDAAIDAAIAAQGGKDAE